VSLYLLNNAFLLDLSLETAKCALNGFSVENPDFCQNVPPAVICGRAVSMSGWCAESNASFSDACGDLSFTRKEQLISFVLKLLKCDLSAGVGLQMCVELIVLLQTGFEGRVSVRIPEQNF
jgi:hypothetical protein